MTRRTYWHLAALGRKPTDYDIASSRLLYYTERGFETELPLAAWYHKHQRGSPLACGDWDRFRDPRETTYAKYVDLQRTKEMFVDGVLAATDDGGYDRRLSAGWLATLDRMLAPLRYPVHGLQMIAAYLGHMAPGGRIVIACALQAADEVRRIQRLAYRQRQVQAVAPQLGADARARWQTDPMWQPLREVIEHLLVCYDWGEALIALQLALKPRLDALITVHLAELARRHGDHALANMLFSLGEDCRWHREWSRALIRLVLSDRPDNRAVVRGWLARWNPAAARAIAGFGAVFEPHVMTSIEDDAARLELELGLEPAP